MKKRGGSIRGPADRAGTPETPEQYLDIVRSQVTRNFCIFCFGLSLLAVPATLLAKDIHTQIINNTAILLYGIPLLMTFRKADYRKTARLFVVIATTVVFANGLSSNCDLSPATIVWYFVYVVFAHLVLGLQWAVGIAVVGFLSVLAFSIVQLTGHQYINKELLEDSVIAGSPVAMFAAFVQLLYLMFVYKKLWNELFGRIVASDCEKSQLVGVMSHDLRNYIGAVQGINSMMCEDVDEKLGGPIKTEFSNNLVLVDQATTEALKLVEEVVSAARNENSTDLFVEEMDLRDFVVPIFQRYQVLARAKEVRFVLETGDVPVIASINRDRFSRVVENLLSNALKFTKKNDTVSIILKQSDHGIEIRIVDTGIGIPADLHQVLFELFTKAGRSGTAKEKSIGLGLSIVKKNVSLHGGVIRFESEEGKGTTFIIELPAAGKSGTK
ncbi:MAG: HAMP domain-containing histidine kinase [Chitinispirillaceae bacterium]|nr:HAMP domain-containing histidine kinase [Chitinispirillaceae bacterium]